MHKRASEMELEIKHKMRGGSGQVEILHIIKKEEFKGKARLFARLSIGPGCSIGLHEHIGEEEVFYILKGRGIVEDSGKRYEAEPGDAILTGGGASHSIACIGEEPLEFLAVIIYAD